MTPEETLRFMNENPVFFLATVKDDKPYVRGMMLYQADELGIVFGSTEGKDLHQQLLMNPAVELCFYDSGTGQQVRVGGSVEYLQDPDIAADLVMRFPFLKAGADTEPVLYRLRHGVVTVWTPGREPDSKAYESI